MENGCPLFPFVFSYSYNASYKLATETYPSGRTVTMGYDDAGRVKYLQCQSTNYAGSENNPIQYASHGAMSSVTMGNGITESRSL
jgi:uncharacterized protein RhaS with RHS repeats